MPSGQATRRKQLQASPRACLSLGQFVEATKATRGLAVDELADGTRLHVRTENTTYQILISDARRQCIVIVGGRHFPIPTPATLNGSTLGGSLIKAGWIGLGMCLELQIEATTIVTSPVQGIATQSQTSPHADALTFVC